jgi:hypothetical protein
MSFSLYRFYYNEYEKLIYAEIVHHRSLNYHIYVYENELLYTNITDVNGDMHNLKTLFYEENSYKIDIILQDLKYILTQAYK